MSQGGSQKTNKAAAQKQIAEFKTRHGTVADCNKKNEALFRVHGWGVRKGIGGGTSRTWPNFFCFDGD